MTEEFDVVFFEIDLKVIVFGEIVNKIIFNELPLIAAADDERIRSPRVIEVLARLVSERGAPAFLRGNTKFK